MKELTRPSLIVSIQIAVLLWGALLPAESVAQTWVSTDINLPEGQAPGSTTSLSNDVHDIVAGGTGIGSTSDSFRLVSQLVTGNIEVETQLVGVEGYGNTSEAGLTIRQGSGAATAFAAVTMDANRELRFRWRTLGAVASAFSLGTTVPEGQGVWFRLVRTGPACAGYYSSDGINWSLVGSAAISLSNSFEAGLMACSGSADDTVEVGFERAVVTTNVPQRQMGTTQSGAAMRLWLRADSNVVYDEAGRVSKWEDFSGYANDAFAIGGAGASSQNRPLLAHDSIGFKRGVRFDNDSLPSLAERKYLKVNDHGTLNPQRTSLFMVAKWEADPVPKLAGLLSKGGSAAGYTLGFDTAVPRVSISGSVEKWAAKLTPGQPYLMEAVFDQTGVRLYVNGQMAPVPTPRTTVITSNTYPLFIGQYLSSPTVANPTATQVYPFTGDIAEVIVFNDAVTENKRRELEVYFKSKYQIPALPTPKVEVPSINAVAGIYASAQTVSISVPDGAAVYYRIDGGDALLYTGPITLSDGTESLTAWAEKTGHLNSDEVTTRIVVDGNTEYVDRSGLQLWLRADTGVSLAAGGSDVLQWRSQVPPYFTANAGATNRPIWQASGTGHANRASIAFLNDWLRVTTPTGSPLALNHHSICVVAKVSDTTPASPTASYSALLSRLSSDHGYYFGLKMTQPLSSPILLQLRSRVAYRAPGASDSTIHEVITPIVSSPATPFLSVGTWNAHIATFNQTDMILRVNREQRGIKPRTVQVGDPVLPYLLIGAHSAATTPSQPLQGDIAEILVYDRELTVKQMRELEAYLQDRYQLSHAVTPSVDLKIHTNPGLYASPPQIVFSSNDAATITYTVNGHGSSNEGAPFEPITYSSPFTPQPEHALSLSGGVDRYTIAVTAAKSGFTSTTRTVTYYVDPRTGDVPRTGLKLWLRGDLGVTTQTGTTPPQVTRWIDQSGSANHLKSADGVVKPYRLTTTSIGKPAVSFGTTGLSQMLPESNNFSLGAAANNDITILAVVKDNGSADNAVVVEQETVDNSLGFSLRYRAETGGMSIESKFNASTIKAVNSGPPSPPPTPYLAPAGFNLIVQRALGTSPTSASSHVLGVNRSGTKSASSFAAITNPASQLFSLGARRIAQVQDPLNSATMPINGLNGEIAELLVFDGFLSELEIQRLEAYLAYRYSLSNDSRVTLPTLSNASVSPGSGTWAPGTDVEITHNETNVSLSYRYMLGTSIPAGTPWSTYNGSIELNAPGAYTLEVRSEKPGYLARLQTVRLTIDPVIQGLPREDLALWLAADRGISTTVVNNVHQVNEWLDESGNGYKALPVATTRKPTFIDSPTIKYNLLNSGGQPTPSKVISFPYNLDRRLQVKDAAKLASTQMTVFVVSRSRNSVATHTLLQRPTADVASPLSGWNLSYLGVQGDGVDTYLNNILLGPESDPDFLWVNISNNDSAPKRVNDVQPSLITGVVGSSLRVLPNLERTGEAEYTGSWSQDVSALGDDLFIGGTSNATLPLNGEIAEVLIYHRVLGQLEVARVQDYLIGKYSLGYKKPLAAPAISPNGGVFSTNTTVTITPPSGASLIYEEDGDGILKTASTTVHITVAAAPNNGVTNKTIKAWCTKAGYTESPKAYAAISVDPYADLVPQGQELALWVRGDSAMIGSASPKVERWLDLSGHGRHLTKPTPVTVGAPEKVSLTSENIFNGWPVLRFSAAAKTCMEGNYPELGSQTVSVFAVIRGPKDTAANTRIIAEKYDSGTAPKGYSLRRTYNGGSRFNFLSNTTSFFLDADPAEQPMMLVGGIHSESGRKAYYQAVEKVSAAFTTQTLLTPAVAPLRVGGSNTTYNFDGEIADLWIYSRALSQAEIDMLGVYAHERYGVDSSKRAPAPTADYLGGTYSAPVDVALNCALPDATIRYVLGTAGQTVVPDPDSNSPVFDPDNFYSRIHVEGSFRILKAYASKAGYVDSEVNTWVFRVEPDKAVVRQGLVAWFKADRGIIDDVNDRVSRWTDQSGLGNDAVAPTPTGTQTFDARPYEITVVGSDEENSFKSLRFNSAGSTQPLGLRIAHPKRFPDPSNPSFKTMSVAVVARKLGTNNGLLFKKAGFELRQSTVSGIPRTTVLTNTSPSFIPVQQDKYEVIVGTYDQVRRIISNGNTVASGALTAALTEDLNPLYIGSNLIANHVYNFQGEIAELLIYNRGLSEAERKYTESSLKSRYGLSNNATTFTLAPPKFVPGGSAATFELPEPCEIALLGPSGAAVYYTTDATIAASPSTATWSLYSEPIFISHHLDKIWAFSRIEGAQATTSEGVSCQFLLDEEKYPPLQPQAGDETPPVITLEKPTHATLSTTP